MFSTTTSLRWEYQAVPAAVPGHTWLVIDSGKKRGLVDSEYDQRRSQCETGLQLLQANCPRPGARTAYAR